MNISKRTKGISTIVLVTLAGIAAFAMIATLSSCMQTPKQTIKIALASNAGTGYEWVVDGETPSTLQQVNSTVEPGGSEEMAGGPVTTTYTFQGMKEGPGTISFRLERAGSPADDDLAITYHFTIDKNLDVVFDGSEGTYFEGETIPTPEVYAQ